MALRTFGITTLFVIAAMAAACISCGNLQASSEKEKAKELFDSKCALCHGVNGDMQLSGAKKLIESNLSVSEIKTLVTEGLRQMPAFKAQLSSEEILMVSEYAKAFQSKK